MGGRYTCQTSPRHVWRPGGVPSSTRFWSRGVGFTKNKRARALALPCSSSCAALRLNVIKLSRGLAILLLEAKEFARFGSPEAVQAQPRPCRSPPARRGRGGPRGTAGPSTLPPRLARTASWRSTRWREPLAAARPRRHRRALGGPLAGAAPRRRLERVAALGRQRKERQPPRRRREA